MSPTVPLVSVEEYLRTSYPDGDREYVDGAVVERNLGEKPHSKIQRKLIVLFDQWEKQGQAFTFPEQRVQVSATRFRVPDLCVYLEEPAEDVFHSPPFLAIEIVSREDRAGDLQAKIEDYLAFGVPSVWVIDPWRRRAYIHNSASSSEVRDGVLRTPGPSFEIPLAQLFD